MNFDKIYKIVILFIFVICTALFLHTTRYDLQDLETQQEGGAIITTVLRYDSWTGNTDIKYILSTIKNQGTILITVNNIYDQYPQVQKQIIKWKNENTKQ